MTTAIPAPVEGFDDAALARAAADGDRFAFGAIYDRYADRLHDFCIGMLRDRDTAADCVQDVFVTAATRLPQLREPDRLRSWLYAIARNEALARIRHRRREQPSEQLPEMASGEPDLATLAARTELAGLISQACRGLSDRDQVVHELAYRQGLNGPELADALGVTHRNANTLVERVRVTIQRSLGALLVCRGVKADPARCPEMAALTDNWDGQFTVLMRKRTARHIDTCRICDDDQARMVNPAALLASVPVFLPAPVWLREQTLAQVEPIFPGVDAHAGADDPSAGAASQTATDPSWWPARDLDTTDLDSPVPATLPRHLQGSASESGAAKASAAYLGRHIPVVVGIGLLILLGGVAAILAVPAIYRVTPINAPGEAATTTPVSTTPGPTTITNPQPGGGGPTVPSVTPTPGPTTITNPQPGGGGPTVPSVTPTPGPTTITNPQPGGGGPTVPSATPTPGPTTITNPQPGGGGPTVPSTTALQSTPPPSPTSSTKKPKPPMGPTGLNPPKQQDPSGSCPPNTTCPTGGPFS